MADENESMSDRPVMAQTPTAAPSAGGAFMKRELNGASFLSLEHVGHMVLVVVVAALVAMGINTAISMWTGTADAIGVSTMFGASLEVGQLQAMGAVGIAAALVVLVPLLLVLDKRTRAEWMKRRGYSGRVAYKVPVYAALGVLVAAKLAADIAMLTVVLVSLVNIGVASTDTPGLYLTQFVPALVSAVVFGVAAWYVFKLAKGHDMGKQFSMLMALVGVALVVSLLITAVSAAHSAQETPSPYDYMKDYDSNNLEDIFKY